MPGRGRGVTSRARRAFVMCAALFMGAGVVAAVIVARRPQDAGVATVPPGETGHLVAPAVPASRLGSDDEMRTKVQTVVRQTELLYRTVFAREVESQQYEEFFVRLWDAFRAAAPGDKMAVLEGAARGGLSFRSAGEAVGHNWGVTVTAFDGPTRSVDPVGWRVLIGDLRRAGYRPTELEFHQSEFVHEAGEPARSTVATLVHLVNDKASSRQVLRAKLHVEWAERHGGAGEIVPPGRIEATDVSLAERVGGIVFHPVALPGGSEAGGLPVRRGQTAFVLAHDLDGDGLTEILVPGENLLLRNRGGWRFDRERLLAGGDWVLEASLVADFTGDGLPDLLCTRGEHLYVARGVPGGRFALGTPQQAVGLRVRPQSVTALTAGDVDGDGDLDAWVGQYKRPYAGGQMPTPYYDANDGLPAALLLNDGSGVFTDETEAAGLARKRNRRTYAASLIDLDGDRDLDLLVNSDFAGLDIHHNDGRGRFTDVTERVIDERHNFGMGHTFADFNLDGLLDMYTIGMSSTTARRLTAMGAGLDEFPEHQKKRPQMGYGNRMFLATTPAAPAGSAAPARFVQPPYRDDVARTGWSWGASSPDFDNDGDPDLYIANGNISGTTCRDYCTTYWRRDIYLGSSSEDLVIENLFDQHGMPAGASWNGFEHNVLFMNEGGKGFLNVAHLMGVAFEFDSRNIITDDFDGDGKMDLLVLEKKPPGRGRALHMLRNDWPTPHHWIGVRLGGAGAGFGLPGAEVRVRTPDGAVRVARVVAGDSFQSQHPAAKHFGLGADGKVESVEVRWPSGEITRLEEPAADRWHDVRPGAGRSPGR